MKRQKQIAFDIYLFNEVTCFSTYVDPQQVCLTLQTQIPLFTSSLLVQFIIYRICLEMSEC